MRLAQSQTCEPLARAPLLSGRTSHTSTQTCITVERCSSHCTRVRQRAHVLGSTCDYARAWLCAACHPENNLASLLVPPASKKVTAIHSNTSKLDHLILWYQSTLALIKPNGQNNGLARFSHHSQTFLVANIASNHAPLYRAATHSVTTVAVRRTGISYKKSAIQMLDMMPDIQQHVVYFMHATHATNVREPTMRAPLAYIRTLKYCI
eukprot:1723542-Pleurochrysis_carterae.AAC.2